MWLHKKKITARYKLRIKWVRILRTMTKFEDLSENDKTVLLVHTNDSHRGPGMVVQNLQKGLKAIGVQYRGRFDSMPSKYTGVLQDYDLDSLKHWHEMKTPLLLGPNLFVLPTDNPNLCKMFDNFVVPTQWVKNLYEGFDLMKGKNIHVWPVGIDTEEWKPVPREDSELDCVVYHKNRSEQDLAIVEAICKKFKLNYKVFKYGSYEEHELKGAAEQARFAILVTGTESQGIAYMQILSTDTPCYVFNSPTWKSEDGSIVVPASSVSYWDDRCGYKSETVDLKHFEEFMTKVSEGQFNPRDYILENHTLEKSAQEYYNLLRTCYGENPIKF